MFENLWRPRRGRAPAELHIVKAEGLKARHATTTEAAFIEATLRSNDDRLWTVRLPPREAAYLRALLQAGLDELQNPSPG